MTIEELKTKKKILIIGYGVEGKAVHEFLKQRTPNAEIRIVDKNDGADYLDKQSDYDLAIKSPGVMPALVTIPYTTATNIFFSNYKGKSIGVTGTKGKGTTSSIIYEMLVESGRDAYLGGNIGEPPINFLHKLTDQSWSVLELSSFQLQDLNISPNIAVVLMVTSDHLNYHKNISEYVSAKRNILRFQAASDFAIINRDYPASHESDIYSEGKVFYVSREREGKDGSFLKDEILWMSIDGNVKKIIDIKDILLPGKHNLENVAAASLAAHLTGVGREDIVKVLRTFKGLEHRLELVREINNVKYYDDSFSVVPEATIAAIESFREPEILILGGSSKNADFTELGKVISNAKNVKAIIGIGDEWWEIRSKIKDQRSKILMVEDANDMKTVVAAASKIAQSGDVVLLSPGCASFGMFKNYKDRGEQFKKEVNNISIKS